MQGRIELAIVLASSFAASAVAVGVHHIRWGRLPFAIGRHGTAAERFLVKVLLVLLVVYVACGALVLSVPDALDRVHVYDALDGATPRAIGLLTALASLALVFWAQLTMGESWRIGIPPRREDEKLALVQHGPFRLGRNPIYAGMMGLALALVLLVLCDVSVILASLVVLTLHVQARLEEDYLVEIHGDAYRHYLRETGRFLPRMR